MTAGTILLAALLALLCALPLAWKWHLGVRRVAFFTAIVATFYGLLLALVHAVIPLSVGMQIGLIWLLTLITGVAMLAYRFYRDPERPAPDREDVISARPTVR
jgi:phosphatidylserine decarboxylase